jgi:hypothetical protein
MTRTGLENAIAYRKAYKASRYGHNKGRTFPADDEVTTCVYCGRSFERKSRMGPRPLTCGDPACLQAAEEEGEGGKRQNARNHYRTCEQCGIEFPAAHPTAKYCSTAHRVAAYRERKKAQPAS